MNVKDANLGEFLPEQDKQKHSPEALRVRDWETLSFVELLTSFKKSLRNGNWSHLNPLDKALYRASLWYAKHRGSIINALIVEKLLGLIEKLRETKGMRIFKNGLKKVITQLKKGEEEIVARAPQLKVWRKDPDYIFLLGTKR